MRILSGIQPSGSLHLGNYYGMMQPAIALQDEGEAFYFIADYHSLTSVNDPEVLRENIRYAAIDFMACGLDPEKAVFFRQSDVPEVTELTWLLSCVCPMGLLQRCHSYKDKIAKGVEASHGLFAYPVLMAADILIYDSDVVPVGKDQKQHIEVTRDLANKINSQYGEGLLVVPEPRIREATAKVPGVDGEKMGKSAGNGIGLFEPQKQFRKKVMSIKTDSTPVEDPKDPDTSIIYDLFKLVGSDDDVQSMAEDFRKGGVGYGDFKKRLFEALWDSFEPFREKRAELEADPDYIEDVLKKGAKTARETAVAVLNRVRTAMGL